MATTKATANGSRRTSSAKRKTAKKQTCKTSSRSKFSVEKCWKDGDELSAVEAIIIKYAKMIDATDSSRDLKPLASGMLEAIDRKNALEAAEGSRNENKAPVFKILEKAQSDAQAKMKAANGE